tara:strand:- start:353 stop:523 length:171 start_codon:yes stop_codon:yes gene_type:complete
LPEGHSGHLRLQKLVGSTISIKGRPQTIGQRNNHDKPIELSTAKKFASRLKENTRA